MSAAQDRSRRGPPMPIARVVADLTGRMESLVETLLPNGRYDGSEYVVGSVAGEPGRSLSICIRGDRRGVWADFSTQDMRGDALDLVAAVNFGGDKKRAYEWAVSWLGLDGRDAGRLRTERAVAPVKKQETEGESNTRRMGRALWFGAFAIEGSPVEAYLARRGISLRALGRVPNCIRSGEAWHKETKKVHPAMLTAIVGPDGGVVSCHRTYLQRYPGGAVDGSRAYTDKLRGVEDAKLTLGTYRGGAIRLWRGLVTDPETGEVKPLPPIRRAVETSGGAGLSLTLCEGIEDGLTLALADPGRRVWSAVSLANMAHVVLPDAITDLVIAADNDDHRQAKRDFDKVIAAHRQAGRRVTIIRPPEGVKDFNDLLRGERK